MPSRRCEMPPLPRWRTFTRTVRWWWPRRGSTLRAESFNFSVQKSKELQPLEAALMSQYADVRKLSVDQLIRKHTPAAVALLVKALSDPEKDVRLKALDSLVHSDAREALVKALT